MLYTPLFIISHLTVLPALVIARCALLRRRHTCLRLGSIMSEQATRDSEEEDSDYVQGDNGDDDEDDEQDDQDKEGDSLGRGIAAHKRSAVDALWAEMKANDALSIGLEAGRGAKDSSKANGTKAKKKKSKADKKATKVLSSIFGKQAASSIVSGASKSKGMKRKAPGATGDRGAESRAKTLAASRTVEFSEVKKFAGQEVLVKRKVTAGSAEHASAAKLQKKAGIDSVLAAIDGPKTISTVTKSSMDWDTYKAAEGIEGEMQQATKEGKGYLNKQDFLQRCDVRRFEQELESRQAKRDA